MPELGEPTTRAIAVDRRSELDVITDPLSGPRFRVTHGWLMCTSASGVGKQVQHRAGSTWPSAPGLRCVVDYQVVRIVPRQTVAVHARGRCGVRRLCVRVSGGSIRACGSSTTRLRVPGAKGGCIRSTLRWQGASAREVGKVAVVPDAPRGSATAGTAAVLLPRRTRTLGSGPPATNPIRP